MQLLPREADASHPAAQQQSLSKAVHNQPSVNEIEIIDIPPWLREQIHKDKTTKAHLLAKAIRYRPKARQGCTAGRASRLIHDKQEENDSSGFGLHEQRDIV